MVEAWVWGTPWTEIKSATNLDDGDTARLFCRIADLLRDIRESDAVALPLRAAAEEAHEKMYRAPVCDLLAVH